jgi:hypothetical protein
MASHGSVQAQGVKTMDSPMKRINDKAKSARGPNARAIRDLLDEIFEAHGWNQDLGSASENLKQRIVNAEVRYQTGAQAGVPRKNIVETANAWARKINAPAWALTSDAEVRRMRARMMTWYPNLIGRGRQVGGRPLDEDLGPVEAFFTFAQLVHNKLHWTDYQMTPEERAKARREVAGKPQKTQPGPQLQAQSGRSVELQLAIHNALTSMSADELEKMKSETLRALGIEE